MSDDHHIKYQDLPARYRDDAIVNTAELLADQPATALDLARLESDVERRLTKFHWDALGGYRSSYRSSQPSLSTTTIRETPTVAYWAIAISVLAAITATLAITF